MFDVHHKSIVVGYENLAQSDLVRTLADGSQLITTLTMPTDTTEGEIKTQHIRDGEVLEEMVTELPKVVSTALTDYLKPVKPAKPAKPVPTDDWYVNQSNYNTYKTALDNYKTALEQYALDMKEYNSLVKFSEK